MELALKLSNIQNELKAPKNQFNNFGSYKYRSCEDILESLKPLLLKYKCTLIVNDTIESIGPRFYVKATATLHDCESDKTLIATANAREQEIKKGMDESQITGSASSYARKYALNGLFCIDDTKDADATNKHDDKKQATPIDSNLITESQAKKLFEIAYGDLKKVKTVIMKHNYINTRDIKKIDYEKIIKDLEESNNE